MNEELLCAAIFEQAISDYEGAVRFLRHPHGNKKDMERDIAKAEQRIAEVRRFAVGPEAMKYSGGSDKVIRAFVQRMKEIDREY